MNFIDKCESSINKNHLIVPRVTELDLKVPPIQPVFERLSINIYEEIINTLTLEILGKTSSIDSLIEFVKKSPMAVISNKSKKVYLDFKKRRSFRHTFGPETIKKLSPIIEKVLKKTNLPEFRIDPSHGDILGYQGDPINPGHFGLHRDSKNVYPFKKKHEKYKRYKEYPHMFSFLLILSSENTYPNEFEEGGTEIWCLPKNTLYYFKFNKNIEIILRKKLKRHLSPAITRQFVVFPSNALHQSLPIYNSGRFKLALKIDLWVKNYSSPLLSIDCNCSQCNPFLYPTKKQIARCVPKEYIGLILLKKIPLELNEYICSFLVKKKKNKLCDYTINCSCINCVEYEAEEIEYSDDDFCNGYDY